MAAADAAQAGDEVTLRGGRCQCRVPADRIGGRDRAAPRLDPWVDRRVSGAPANGSCQCLLRRAIVRGLAHVQPGLVHGIDQGALALGAQAFEKGRHVAGAGAVEGRQGRGLQGIDAGIDQGAGDGLFLKADQLQAAGEDHAVGRLPLLLAHGHGGGGAVAAVEVEQGAVLDVGEHIAIGDEEGSFRTRVEQGQGAGGAEGCLFAQVLDADSPGGAVGEVVFDQVAQVVDGENEVAEALVPGALQDVLQHGLAGHGQQGLGAVFGVGPQPGALAAGHDDHEVRTGTGRGQVAEFVPQVQAQQAALGVHHRQLQQFVGAHEMGDGVAVKARGDHEGVAVDEGVDRAVQVEPAQQAAADVAVSEGTDEAARRVHDQGDAQGGVVEDLDGLAQAGTGGDQGAAPGLGGEFCHQTAVGVKFMPGMAIG